MTASIENIVQHLFHQPSLQSVSVDELQQMTQEYPSFAAARFLLLKKMQDTDHPDFSSQLQKTSVYFNNPLWLQLLLSPQGESAIAWRPSNGTVIATDDHHLYGQEEHETPGTDTEEYSAPAAEALAKEPDGQLMQEVMDRLRDQIYEADVHEQPSSSAASEALAKETPTTVHDPLMQEVMDRLREQIQEADVHEEPASASAAEASAKEAIPAEPTTPEEDFTASTAEADATEGPAYPGHGTETPESSIKKIIIETPMAKGDTLFEPYHTIDYFASQGIRLDKLEPVPQDKLGRQLKSFTEWLKSMKRLPQATIEKKLGENEESAVVAAASHSIEGRVVITEAMAEVFEKQGMYDKAAEVYRKLSLLNPAKSAYFADRIKALKQ